MTTDSGLTLHVVEYDGEGPPLLAVHGTGLVAQVWGVMAPYLAPYVRLFALDRKGHGESDKPPEGYEPETAIEEYVTVVRQLGGEGWTAIGHSSGGTSLALAAVRHPALFRALILVDPIIYPARGAPAAGAEMANTFVERTRDRRDRWPSAQAMFDDLSTKRAYRTWQPEALWDYVRHGAETGEDGSVRLTCLPELEARMYGSASSLDLFEEVARIAVPTLVLRGGESDRFPRGNAGLMAASNPRIRLVEMPGLTHFASMEDPEGVARFCVDFLGGDTVSTGR
ncbi:MAG: alpha/beta fold hydrolase [Dehalococcoidia bacterium]